MLSLIVRNWKYALILLGTLAAIIFLGLWRLEVAETKNLKSQIDTLQDTVLEREEEIAQCASDKKISERSSNDYQKSLTSLRRQLNSLRNDQTCVPTEPSVPSNGHNGTATGGIISGRSGLRTGYLIDLGGRCEETRLKLLGCQKFINDTWTTRGKKE